MSSSPSDAEASLLDDLPGVTEVKEWAPVHPTGLWMVEVMLGSGRTLRACAKTAARARKRLHLKLSGETAAAA